jgi:hypothetical protein
MNVFGFLFGGNKETKVMQLESEIERLKQREVRGLKKEIQEARSEELQHLDNHFHSQESGVRKNNDLPMEFMKRAVELDGGMEGGKKKGLSAKDAIRQSFREWNEKALMSQGLVWRASYEQQAASTLYSWRKKIKAGNL